MSAYRLQTAPNVSRLTHRRSGSNRAYRNTIRFRQAVHISLRDIRQLLIVDLFTCLRIQKHSRSHPLPQELQTAYWTHVGIARQNYDGIGFLLIVDDQEACGMASQHHYDQRQHHEHLKESHLRACY